MKKTIKTLSIIAVVLGAWTILSAFSETSFEEAGYALLGGGMFLGYGICVLIYLGKQI